MYCVKCGVKLQNGVKMCPLCGTPVWNPEEGAPKAPEYPARYPETRNFRRSVALIFTVLAAAALMAVSLVYSLIGNGKAWGWLAFGGIIVAYFLIIFPLWFQKLHPAIYVPVGHLVAGVYLWLICRLTGGGWFWSFAFPIVGIHAIILTAATVLLHHIKRNRLFIFGGLFIALGIFTMLIELFLYITFALPMFAWSIYTLAALAGFGFFLILAGIIKPLKEFLRKNFFF